MSTDVATLPLKVGDWVTVKAAKHEAGYDLPVHKEFLGRTTRIVGASRGFKKHWQLALSVICAWSEANIRRATPAEIAAATGQPPVVKESLNTEIEVGDTVELLPWPDQDTGKVDDYVRALVGNRVVLEGHSVVRDYSGEAMTFDFAGITKRWPRAFMRLVSKGKKSEAAFDSTRCTCSPRMTEPCKYCRGEIEEEADKVLEQPACPACGGDRYLPDEWGRCDEKHRVPCAKCNFKAGEPEPVLPPAPVHRMTEAGECVLTVAALSQAAEETAAEMNRRAAVVRKLSKEQCTQERCDWVNVATDKCNDFTNRLYKAQRGIK